MFVGSVWVAAAVADPLAPEPLPVAAAAAVFVCVTAPLSPALATRSETFVLLGASCVAAADAEAVVVSVGNVPVLAAVAVAAAVFAWVTAPLSPGAPTRTSTFLLLALCCFEDADARAWLFHPAFLPFVLPPLPSFSLLLLLLLLLATGSLPVAVLFPTVLSLPVFPSAD